MLPLKLVFPANIQRSMLWPMFAPALMEILSVSGSETDATGCKVWRIDDLRFEAGLPIKLPVLGDLGRLGFGPRNDHPGQLAVTVPRPLAIHLRSRLQVEGKIAFGPAPVRCGDAEVSELRVQWEKGAAIRVNLSPFGEFRIEHPDRDTISPALPPGNRSVVLKR